MIDAFAPFEHAWRQRHAAPPAGCVLAVGAGVPVEMIVAAGLRPWRAFPQRGAPTPLADAMLEPVFDGAIRSLCDRFLAGAYAGAALALVSRAGEGLLQLHYLLDELQRQQRAPALPLRHLFDLLKSPHWATRGYLREQLVRLDRALQAVGGTAVSDAPLDAANRACQTQRRLLAEANAWRRGPTPRVVGSRMLKLIGAGGLMPIDEHIAALQQLLEVVPALPPLPGPRVMLAGSAQDDTTLYEQLEALGAVVVADDHLHGEPWFDDALPADAASPWDALAAQLHLASPTLRSMPQAAADRRFAARVRDAAVQGVLFVIEAHDDTLGWELPRRRALLDEAGVPSLVLLHRPWGAAAPAEQIQPWIEALR